MLDAIGQEIAVGNIVITTDPRGYKRLVLAKVTKITTARVCIHFLSKHHYTNSITTTPENICVFADESAVTGFILKSSGK